MAGFPNEKGFPVENSESECSSQGERAQLCTDCQIASSRPRMGSSIVMECVVLVDAREYVYAYMHIYICVYVYIYVSSRV